MKNNRLTKKEIEHIKGDCVDYLDSCGTYQDICRKVKEKVRKIK
mgnify:CR=1 FL=1